MNYIAEQGENRGGTARFPAVLARFGQPADGPFRSFSERKDAKQQTMGCGKTGGADAPPVIG